MTSMSHKRSEHNLAPHLHIIHPLTGQLTSTAVTVFADDVGSIRTGESFEQLHAANDLDDKLFNTAFNKVS